MMTYLDCWTRVAGTLFSQALAGEPELVDSTPRPFEKGGFGFAATITGDRSGRFSVVLDAAVLDSPLLGDGEDQKAGWSELLREAAEAAAGDLLARSGARCRVEAFGAIEAEKNVSHAFQLKTRDRAWTVLVRDEVREPKPAASEHTPVASSRPAPPDPAPPEPPLKVRTEATGPGLDLLLDVELEATLRFGCRELPLGEILDLGPGDVVQLDRNVSDPVDLVVADKIVARGEVVLINGNFGLRVTEVATPRKRLESIRCLF
jgi:flagellar motor switch protein FliN/FliY